MHRHKVYDTDSIFSVVPHTRILKNEKSAKITLIQHDHNSERFTFEIPRFIEEHDMSECNVVQVHYINIESGNPENQSKDVYDVEDLHISIDDDNKVICSWLISQNATKYVGSLNFVVRFSCVTNGVVNYAWNTAVYSGIFVSSGIYNSDVIAEEHSDILASWAARIEALEQGGFGGGTTDHSKLTNRDADDQHPISAITGLQNELNKLQNAKNITLKNNDPEFWENEDDISVQDAIDLMRSNLKCLYRAESILYTITDPETGAVEFVSVQMAIDAIISKILETEYITAEDMPEIVKSVIDNLPKYNGEVAEV